MRHAVCTLAAILFTAVSAHAQFPQTVKKIGTFDLTEYGLEPHAVLQPAELAPGRPGRELISIEFGWITNPSVPDFKPFPQIRVRMIHPSHPKRSGINGRIDAPGPCLEPWLAVDHAYYVEAADLNGDGRDDLLFHMINNGGSPNEVTLYATKGFYACK